MRVELIREFITKDEAKQLADAHEEWTRWILIPSDEKHRLLERINSRLQAEGIPPVEMIILKWRVSQLLRDIQRKYSTCKYPASAYILCIPQRVRIHDCCAQSIY